MRNTKQDITIAISVDVFRADASFMYDGPTGKVIRNKYLINKIVTKNFENIEMKLTFCLSVLAAVVLVDSKT